MLKDDDTTRSRKNLFNAKPVRGNRIKKAVHLVDFLCYWKTEWRFVFLVWNGRLCIWNFLLPLSIVKVDSLRFLQLIFWAVAEGCGHWHCFREAGFDQQSIKVFLVLRAESKKFCRNWTVLTRKLRADFCSCTWILYRVVLVVRYYFVWCFFAKYWVESRVFRM